MQDIIGQLQGLNRPDPNAPAAAARAATMAALAEKNALPVTGGRYAPVPEAPQGASQGPQEPAQRRPGIVMPPREGGPLGTTSGPGRPVIDPETWRNAKEEDADYNARMEHARRLAEYENAQMEAAAAAARQEAGYVNRDMDMQAAARARAAAEERQNAEAENANGIYAKTGERLNANWENSDFDARGRRKSKQAAQADRAARLAAAQAASDTTPQAAPANDAGPPAAPGKGPAKAPRKPTLAGSAAALTEALQAQSTRRAEAVRALFPADGTAWSGPMSDTLGVQHGAMMEHLREVAKADPVVSKLLAEEDLPKDEYRALTNYVRTARDKGLIPRAAGGPTVDGGGNPVRNPQAYQAALDQEAAAGNSMRGIHPSAVAAIQQGKTPEARATTLDGYLANLRPEDRAGAEALLRPLTGFGYKGPPK